MRSVAQPLVGDQAALATDQLVEAVLGQELVVDADVLDLPDGVDALDVESELALVAGAGVDDPDLVDRDHLAPSVLH
jgi:hypothetical protein